MPRFYNVAGDSREVNIYAEDNAKEILDLSFDNTHIIINKFENLYLLEVCRYVEDVDDDHGSDFEADYECRFETDMMKLLQMHLEPDERFEVRKSVTLVTLGTL